jgi:hypothetical protein
MPVIAEPPRATNDALRAGQAIAALFGDESRERGDARIDLEPFPKVGPTRDLGEELVNRPLAKVMKRLREEAQALG